MPELLNLLLVIVICGVLVWLVSAVVPMPPVFHTIFYLVIVGVVLIYILQFMGVISPILPVINVFK